MAIMKIETSEMLTDWEYKTDFIHIINSGIDKI